MTTQISHFISGQRTAGQSTRSADVFDPNTGQVRRRYRWPASDGATASAVRAGP